MKRLPILLLLAAFLFASNRASSFDGDQPDPPEPQETEIDEGWRKDASPELPEPPEAPTTAEPGESGPDLPEQREPEEPEMADPAQVFVSRGAALHRLRLTRGESWEVGRFGKQSFTDIACWKKKIYAITFRDFYVIEPGKARYEHIGPIGSASVNALAVDREGKVFAAGGNRLLTIDPDTGRGTLVGHLGAGLTSSGDLAFSPGGTLYLTVKVEGQNTDSLAVVSTRAGKAEVLGDIGYRDVWGLAWYDDFLFGVTDAGAVLTLDTSTGRGKLMKDKVFPKCWGMAVRRP